MEQVQRPQIGCVSWCFHSFAGGTSPEAALDILGEIGFEGTDLILLGRADIKNYWTDAKIDQIKLQLERNHLTLAQFVIFQPVIEGLSSTDAEQRKISLDYFEAGCRIGQKLGAPLLNIVAPWARELSSTVTSYIPRYYDIPNPKPGEKFHLDVASGFDWDTLWQNYIDITKECLERVKAHGMKMTIEHHTHTMIPDAVSFLRLYDAVGDTALGYNMDIGWTLSQREYPPVAIHKVKAQLMNLHMRDIDGMMSEFVDVGTGVMDFQAVADTLNAIRFRGFVSIEQDKSESEMRETCARYLTIMRECFA